MKLSLLACILIITGCATNARYCGIEYSDSYDIAKGILPYPPEPAPRVVTRYTYKDIKSNPFYYSVNTF